MVNLGDKAKRAARKAKRAVAGDRGGNGVEISQVGDQWLVIDGDETYGPYDKRFKAAAKYRQLTGNGNGNDDNAGRLQRAAGKLAEGAKKAATAPEGEQIESQLPGQMRGRARMPSQNADSSRSGRKAQLSGGFEVLDQRTVNGETHQLVRTDTDKKGKQYEYTIRLADGRIADDERYYTRDRAESEFGVHIRQVQQGSASERLRGNSVDTPDFFGGGEVSTGIPSSPALDALAGGGAQTEIKPELPPIGRGEIDESVEPEIPLFGPGPEQQQGDRGRGQEPAAFPDFFDGSMEPVLPFMDDADSEKRDSPRDEPPWMF